MFLQTEFTREGNEGKRELRMKQKISLEGPTLFRIEVNEGAARNGRVSFQTKNVVLRAFTKKYFDDYFTHLKVKDVWVQICLGWSVFNRTQELFFFWR